MTNSEVSFGKSTLSIVPKEGSQPTVLERGDFSGKENTAQQERLVDAAQHKCLVDGAQQNSLVDGIQGMKPSNFEVNSGIRSLNPGLNAITNIDRPCRGFQMQELKKTSEEEQCLLNDHCLPSSDSTFFIDHHFAVRIDSSTSLDDEMDPSRGNDLTLPQNPHTGMITRSKSSRFCRMQVYNVKPKSMDSESGKTILCSLNLNPVSQATIKVKWVSWLYPPEGRLKLSIDGASKGNPGEFGVE
ncbi:unnamed protein product [Ilex paraguariensis]|uniref:Uncharacterized protein n=1 Tax=Ilex paraguariensis TaxID=185542 RepID=A0ABC8SB34_9AQUA